MNLNLDTIYQFQAPAKINSYLYIVGKRSDGYHLLDTEFQLIDVCDTVRLRLRQDGHVQLHTPIQGLPDEQHLAMRAALLLKHHTHSPYGVDIWVDKCIPSGAGLGGGSSDAATTLLALNQFWGCRLSSEQLQSLGLNLGADVPFFCSLLGTAQASGVGEILNPVSAAQQYYVLIFPDCHVSTPAVFKHPDLTWDKKRAIMSGLANKNLVSALNDQSKVRYYNDLQAVAQKIAPQVSQALNYLEQCSRFYNEQYQLIGQPVAHNEIDHMHNQDFSVRVCMSGSGSAVFAVFDTAIAAQTVHNRLKSCLPEQTKSWQTWCVSGLQVHPLYDYLNQV